MLKGINNLLTPDLLKILMEMGYGDEIVISDGNFPATTFAQRLVRLDGNNVPEVLDAILEVMPLDQYVEKQVALMEIVPGDNFKPVIWDTYKEIIAKHEPDAQIEHVERFAYYERAKKAFAVVYTSETSQYANVILKKGCVLPGMGDKK